MPTSHSHLGFLLFSNGKLLEVRFNFFPMIALWLFYTFFIMFMLVRENLLLFDCNR